MRTLLYNLCLENNRGFGTKLKKNIVCTHSERRGSYCVVSHVNIGRSGTLAYTSFRWRAIRLFNSLPKFITCTTSCSVYGFKHTLDSYLMNIVDNPCVSGFNNSLDGGDCIKWRTLCDDLAANNFCFKRKVNTSTIVSCT